VADEGGVPVGREGVFDRGRPLLGPTGFVPKYELPGPRRPLAAYAAEYALFTPAPLYLYAGFRDAPLADLMAERPGLRFYWARYDRPLFAGLEAPSNGDAGWNYGVWAVAPEHWQAVSDWLVSLALVAADGSVFRVGEQRLSVTEPQPEGDGPPPRVPVVAFGLDGDRFRAYFADGDDGPPRLVFAPPSPAARAFATAWRAGANPLAGPSARPEDRP